MIFSIYDMYYNIESHFHCILYCMYIYIGVEPDGLFQDLVPSFLFEESKHNISCLTPSHVFLCWLNEKSHIWRLLSVQMCSFISTVCSTYSGTLFFCRALWGPRELTCKTKMQRARIIGSWRVWQGHRAPDEHECGLVVSTALRVSAQSSKLAWARRHQPRAGEEGFIRTKGTESTNIEVVQRVMLETINTDSLAFEVGAEFYWEVRKPALPMSSNMPQCLRRRPNTSHFERELALRKLVQSLEIELEFGRTWSQSLPMRSRHQQTCILDDPAPLLGAFYNRWRADIMNQEQDGAH